MYDDVYECMVECGVARKLDAPTDQFDGDIVTRYELLHPGMCLVVDEVGSNISQRGDGHITGTKYCCEHGTIPNNEVSHNDRHFTMLSFTALTGEPVLCVIIIAGVTQAFEVEMGIDLDAPTFGNPTDKDYFEKNLGKGKLFPSGPECNFNGKQIPTLVRWSPSGSITSDILVDALATLDYHGVFPRTSNLKPFLLLDGHGSRFELPFLRYVTCPDHPWMVCQGVPYGTSLWQVADSSEQNGQFKAASSKIKAKILQRRLDLMMDSPQILSTDIIPIVNYAWEKSFACVDSNLKAIKSRGWNPLNFNLLTAKQIQPTITNSEKAELWSMMKVQPAKASADTLTQQSSTTGTTIINSTSLSDITDEFEMNYDPYFMNRVPNTVTVSTKLNFKSGRAAHVAQTLLHKSDLIEAREENAKNAKKGKEVKAMLDNHRKLTAMLNFRAFGCKIGEDSLKARLKMAEKKSQEEARIVQKKNDKIMKRKLQYDQLKQKIIDENVPVDKLSMQQLKILLMQKKRDDDKISISKMKRSELIPLWIAWQSRPDIEIEDVGVIVNNNTEVLQDHNQQNNNDCDPDVDHDNIIMI